MQMQAVGHQSQPVSKSCSAAIAAKHQFCVECSCISLCKHQVNLWRTKSLFIYAVIAGSNVARWYFRKPKQWACLVGDVEFHWYLFGIVGMLNHPRKGRRALILPPTTQDLNMSCRRPSITSQAHETSYLSTQAIFSAAPFGKR